MDSAPFDAQAATGEHSPPQQIAADTAQPLLTARILGTFLRATSPPPDVTTFLDQQCHFQLPQDDMLGRSFHHRVSQIGLPANQSHGAQARLCGAAIRASETLLYRAARHIFDNVAPELVRYWTQSEDTLPKIYRAAKALLATSRPQAAGTPIPLSTTSRGACIGLTWNRSRTPYCHFMPEAALLVNLIVKCAAAADPTLAFTTIQVNQQLRSKLHTDSNSLGPSMVIHIGPYTGGWTWVYSTGCGDFILPSAWHHLDGKTPHASNPFFGDRISLVLFSHKAANMPNAAPALAQTRQLGICPPPTRHLRRLATTGNAECGCTLAAYNQYSQIFEHVADAMVLPTTTVFDRVTFTPSDPTPKYPIPALIVIRLILVACLVEPGSPHAQPTNRAMPILLDHHIPHHAGPTFRMTGLSPHAPSWEPNCAPTPTGATPDTPSNNLRTHNHTPTLPHAPLPPPIPDNNCVAAPRR